MRADMRANPACAAGRLIALAFGAACAFASSDVAAQQRTPPELASGWASKRPVESRTFMVGAANPLAAHDGEARRIDKRIRTLVVTHKPAPRLLLGGFIDMHGDEADESLGSLPEVARSAMAHPPPQECPRLPHDMVCRQQRAGAL